MQSILFEQKHLRMYNLPLCCIIFVRNRVVCTLDVEVELSRSTLAELASFSNWPSASKEPNMLRSRDMWGFCCWNWEKKDRRPLANSPLSCCLLSSHSFWITSISWACFLSSSFIKAFCFNWVEETPLPWRFNRHFFLSWEPITEEITLSTSFCESNPLSSL